MSSSGVGIDNLQSPLLHDAAAVDDGCSNTEKLTVDGALQKYCGEFGWWQFRHFVLASMAWALEGIHTMVMVFADRDPGWRCSSLSTACSAAGNVCGLSPGTWEWEGSSSVAEFGLICGQKYRVGLVQSLFFVGCMIGAGVFGHLSDSRMGRKGSLTLVCIMNAIFGVATAFSPNYWVYAILRLLSGFSIGGTGLCAFVLSTEPIGPTNRGLVGMSTFYFFSAGIVLLSAIAYHFQTSWRALYIASSIPSILYVFLVLPFLEESPRWCLIQGRAEQAIKIMQKIANSNGKHLPENVLLVLDNPQNLLQLSSCLSFTEVLRSPLTRLRLLLAVTINFISSTVYYGLSLNVINLKGANQIYLNVALNAVAEIPACFLAAMWLDKLGRKPLTIGTQWFSAVFCVTGSLMNGYGVPRWTTMICGVLGIFGIAGTYNLLFVFTMELFPTAARNVALGCVTQAAQLGAILVPYIVHLGGGGSIPYLVFGICGFAGGLLTYFLPETLNRPLYDTVDGMEEGEGDDRCA